MGLHEKAEDARDKQDFLDFLDALKKDFAANRETWENQSIDNFLDAIHAWVSDYHNDDINFENPDWKTIAAMFYMGKMYE